VSGLVEASTALEGAALTVTVTAAAQAVPAPDSTAFGEVPVGVLMAAAAFPEEPGAVLPLTAEAISSAVTSGTRRFWVKIQPTGSFWSSPVAVST